jgi:hypothetical protein
MDDRVALEMVILRRQYADARLQDRWVLVPGYQMPDGWIPSVIDAAFFVRDGYPGAGLYGIYVPAGLRFKGEAPVNFSDPAPTQPPFGGVWAIFSWEADPWFPKSMPEAGHNLLTWVQGFAKRFREGK